MLAVGPPLVKSAWYDPSKCTQLTIDAYTKARHLPGLRKGHALMTEGELVLNRGVLRARITPQAGVDALACTCGLSIHC